MNKFKILVILSLVIFGYQFTGLKSSPVTPVTQTLSNFSDNAKYWSVVSLYHDNYHGYQISSTEREKLVLN